MATKPQSVERDANMSASQPLLALDNAFARADAWLGQPGRWYGTLALLAALQAWLIFSHEPWADELQALLIALEAGSQAELLAWLRYEGHPPAWYWLLQALSAFLPREAVLPVAAALCALVVQFAIVHAAPFTRAERLLLATSQYVIFEFLTIARGTSLGVAIIMIALMNWRTRWVWLAMALLPLVDFLFGVISGVFLILQWREGRLWWPGMLLWLAGGLFAAWTVLPPADMVSASQALQMVSGPLAWFLKMGSLPLPFQGGIAPQWNTPVAPFAIVAWPLMLWLCWYLTRGYVWHRLMIFGFFGFTLAFSMAVYPIGLRHLMLGTLLLIALVWLQRAGAAQPSAVFKLWLFTLSACGLASSAISTDRGFDSADAVVAEIERRGLADKTWIAAPEWRVPAVTGRSDIEFIRPAEPCSFRFVRWDHDPAELRSREAFEALLTRHIERFGKSYLLSDRAFEGFDPDLITPLATVAAGYDGIDYELYVIGRRASEKSSSFPRCHSLGSES